MSFPPGWGTLHPSAINHAASLTRWVTASPRPHGAVRYRCPITGSFVLVTDDETLSRLDRPLARMHCPTCREMHLLTQQIRNRDSEAIVAPAS